MEERSTFAHYTSTFDMFAKSILVNGAPSFRDLPRIELRKKFETRKTKKLAASKNRSCKHS